jgi:hypothetical protein
MTVWGRDAAVRDGLAEGTPAVPSRDLPRRSHRPKDASTSRMAPRRTSRTWDAILIAYDTPVSEDGRPDLSPVLEAIDHVAARASRGALVILHSQISVGTADHIRRMLEKAGAGGPPARGDAREPETRPYSSGLRAAGLPYRRRAGSPCSRSRNGLLGSRRSGDRGGRPPDSRAGQARHQRHAGDLHRTGKRSGRGRRPKRSRWDGCGPPRAPRPSTRNASHSSRPTIRRWHSGLRPRRTRR